MNCRAKFVVTKVAELAGYSGGRMEIGKAVSDSKYESTGIPVREITMGAVYDDGVAKENKSFAQATPSGSLSFTLNNAALSDEFKPGDIYYLDFTKAS